MLGNRIRVGSNVRVGKHNSRDTLSITFNYLTSGSSLFSCRMQFRYTCRTHRVSASVSFIYLIVMRNETTAIYQDVIVILVFFLSFFCSETKLFRCSLLCARRIENNLYKNIFSNVAFIAPFYEIADICKQCRELGNIAFFGSSTRNGTILQSFMREIGRSFKQ